MKRWIKLFLRLLRVPREKLAPKRSYAQHAEDLVLKRLLGTVTSFIDIGANDGISVSNSFLFALGGARGLCFEPVLQTFLELKFLHAWSWRVMTVGEGISDRDLELEIVSDGLLSSIPGTDDPALDRILKPYKDPAAKTEKIRVRRLDHWMSRCPDLQSPDFISVDTEGHELSVLMGIDLERVRTRCFVIETHSVNPMGVWWHRDYESIDGCLRKAGYVSVLRSPNNTFWLQTGRVDAEVISGILREFPDYVTPEQQPVGSGVR